MVDLCQWRARIGLFGGSSRYRRPFATGQSFVGFDPVVQCLLGAVVSLAGLIIGVIGAVDTIAATTVEGKHVCIWNVNRRVTLIIFSTFDSARGGQLSRMRALCAASHLD